MRREEQLGISKHAACLSVSAGVDTAVWCGANLHLCIAIQGGVRVPREHHLSYLKPTDMYPLTCVLEGCEHTGATAPCRQCSPLLSDAMICIIHMAKWPQASKLRGYCVLSPVDWLHSVLMSNVVIFFNKSHMLAGGLYG